MQGVLAQSLSVTGGNISALPVLATMRDCSSLPRFSKATAAARCWPPETFIGVIVSQLALRAAGSTGTSSDRKMSMFAVKGTVARGFPDFHIMDCT